MVSPDSKISPACWEFLWGIGAGTSFEELFCAGFARDQPIDECLNFIYKEEKDGT
jgi:hypothetical protein